MRRDNNAGPGIGFDEPPFGITKFSSALAGRNRFLGMSLGFRLAPDCTRLSSAAPSALKNRCFNPLIREQSNPPGKPSQTHEVGGCRGKLCQVCVASNIHMDR